MGQDILGLCVFAGVERASYMMSLLHRYSRGTKGGYPLLYLVAQDFLKSFCGCRLDIIRLFLFVPPLRGDPGFRAFVWPWIQL